MRERHKKEDGCAALVLRVARVGAGEFFFDPLTLKRKKRSPDHGSAFYFSSASASFPSKQTQRAHNAYGNHIGNLQYEP